MKKNKKKPAWYSYIKALIRGAYPSPLIHTYVDMLSDRSAILILKVVLTRYLQPTVTMKLSIVCCGLDRIVVVDREDSSKSSSSFVLGGRERRVQWVVWNIYGKHRGLGVKNAVTSPKRFWASGLQLELGKTAIIILYVGSPRSKRFDSAVYARLVVEESQRVGKYRFVEYVVVCWHVWRSIGGSFGLAQLVFLFVNKCEFNWLIKIIS